MDCYGLQWVDKGHTEVWQGQETGVRNDAERVSESTSDEHMFTHTQRAINAPVFKLSSIFK